jgi:hypothetical protein
MKRGKHFINKKRSELKALFEVYGIQYFRPAEEELVREYVKIMKPMSEALDVLQADEKGFDRISLANADHPYSKTGDAA